MSEIVKAVMDLAAKHNNISNIGIKIMDHDSVSNASLYIEAEGMSPRNYCSKYDYGVGFTFEGVKIDISYSNF